MSDRLIIALRYTAASLITASGLVQVASLWFRPLDEIAVAALLLGAAYLIIGIGLFGQSRLTLFLAILVPAAVAVLTLRQVETLSSLQSTSMVAELLAIVLAAVVLWQVRNRPSR